ncbi:MAG: DUF1684 domain-containing protein [Flavobacteriales bacterium]
MNYLQVLLIIVFFNSTFAQTEEELISEIKIVQQELNDEFSNAKTTILDSLDFASFKGLSFYPIDLKYRVKAKFIRTPNEKPFKMKTSTSRLPEYVKYGEAIFEIDNTSFKLNIYRNIDLSKKEEYKDYLFLPFTDLTSGDGSYGGGRYIDLKIPNNDTLIIDFNKAYNPYCAYSHRYSCPIPPAANDLLVRIEAGVKEYGQH